MSAVFKEGFIFADHGGGSGPQAIQPKPLTARQQRDIERFSQNFFADPNGPIVRPAPSAAARTEADERQAARAARRFMYENGL